MISIENISRKLQVWKLLKLVSDKHVLCVIQNFLSLRYNFSQSIFLKYFSV